MSTEPDDLKAFTSALAGVPPHPGQLNRDDLLFAAGRRSALWPAATAALAVLSGTLGAVLVFRAPTVIEVERIVHVSTPAPSNGPRSVPKPEPVPAITSDDSPTAMSVPSPALAEGLRLRQRLFRDGVGTLPEAPWASPSAALDDVPDLLSLRLNAAHPNGDWSR